MPLEIAKAFRMEQDLMTETPDQIIGKIIVIIVLMHYLTRRIANLLEANLLTITTTALIR